MKNSIFGAIIALIVCACIFSILCVTDVISFNKNNKVNNTDNNTQKDVKETKLCTTSKTLDNNEYKIAIYKVEDGKKNNKIDYLVNNKSIYTYNLDLYKDRVGGIDVFPINTWKECEVYIYDIEDNNHRDIFNIKKITSDNNYNYYLFNVPNLNNLAISENKTTKEFKNLKDLGFNQDYGVVTYETYQKQTENMQCLDRKTIDVVDDYLSELVLPKDISKSEIVTENKYTFKDGKIEQVKSDNLYYPLCNTPW